MALVKYLGVVALLMTIRVRGSDGADPTEVFVKYVYYTTRSSWNLASATCLAIGGRLAQPTTEVRYQALKYIAAGKGLNKFWIGVVRNNDNGNWNNGALSDAIGCSAVATEQNTHGGTDKNCIQATGNNWEGNDCDAQAEFVCEVEDGSDCQQSTDAGTTLSTTYDPSKITTPAVTQELCRSMCRTTVDGSKLCWAAVYDDTNDQCHLYYDSVPDAFSATTADSGLTLMRRDCYSLTTHTNDLSTIKTPDPTYSCTATILTIGNCPASATCPTCSECATSPAPTECATCPTCTECATCPTCPVTNCGTCPVDLNKCPPSPACTTTQIATTEPCECTTEQPSVCPACPTVAPTTECPTCAPSTECPTCAPSTECPTFAPSTECPTQQTCDCTTDAPTTCDPCPTTQGPYEPVTAELCPTCPVVASNLSNTQKEALVEKIIDSLKINTANISSVKAKFVSAADPRPSAKGIGLVLGAGVLSGLGVVILIADFPVLLKDFKGFITNVKSCFGRRI